jgi:hypothetical protein
MFNRCYLAAFSTTHFKRRWWFEWIAFEMFHYVVSQVNFRYFSAKLHFSRPLLGNRVMELRINNKLMLMVEVDRLFNSQIHL